MPLHALLPCTLFTVNLLQLRSLTYTHTRTLHTRSALSCTHALSLSLSAAAAAQPARAKPSAHFVFFYFSPSLLCFFVVVFHCWSPCLSLSLSFLHFLVCYTGNALQSLPDAAATAMQLVGADAGCAVVVAACIVFVCAQIKRNTKIKTKEMEGNYCCCCFKLKLFINLRLCNFISLSLSPFVTPYRK